MNIQMEPLRSFAERHYGAVEHLAATPLSGGLDSFGVYRVQVTFGAGNTGRAAHFVAKHLPESGAREAEVYRILAGSSASAFAPRLLGISGGNSDIYLFLEWIRPSRQWPWRDENATLAVLRRLAELHSQPPARFAGVLIDSSLECCFYIYLAVAQRRGAADEASKLDHALQHVTSPDAAASAPPPQDTPPYQ